MMNQVIPALWIGIFAIWWITGALSKQPVQVRAPGRAHAANWVVGAAWWILLTHGFGNRMLGRHWRPGSAALDAAGLALTAVALAFCLWARFYLGRNWSAVITVTEDHQLIRTGPYAIVRHPIYSGFMLATVGSALAFGEMAGVVAVVLVVAAWSYKASLEEATMVEQFGLEYERYRGQVNALLPFIR
jgi:protein-S-isoprenylcysteine O-methyltransferase Ste14